MKLYFLPHSLAKTAVSKKYATELSLIFRTNQEQTEAKFSENKVCFIC